MHEIISHATHPLPLAALRELAASAAAHAPVESVAMQGLLGGADSAHFSTLAALLGALAAVRASLLAADTDEAAGLWYDLVAASEELRSSCMHAFRASPAAEQEAFLAHLAQLAATHAAPFAELGRILARDEVILAAAGDFKRGKSTVINALLGRPILPTRVAPATAVPCYIRAGTVSAAEVFYDDGRPPATVPLERLERYACIALPGEEEDLAFQPSIARIEITVPWSLPDGVALLDLPGLNEEAGRSEMATTALAHADAVLMVLSATQLLAEDELLLLDQLWRQGHRALVFAINFCDRLEAGEIDLIRERAAHLLAPYEGAFERTIFLISARMARDAQRDGMPASVESGLPALDAHVRTLLSAGRRALWRLSRARQALDALEAVEWDAGRAALEQQDAVRHVREQLIDAQTRAQTTERAHAARMADAEEALGVSLRLLDEHERAYDGAWTAVETELQERCRRETLPWVWQLAGAWLRERLIAAIRAVNPEVTPRPEGYLRIRVPPGLRLGRDALFTFYRDEAAREWERFTATARQNGRRALEERRSAAEATRAQVREEYGAALATLDEQRAQLDAALREALAALERVLAPALAAAHVVTAALQLA
jgi:hypothetical protein